MNSGLIIGSSYIAGQYNASLAFERPVHSAIAFLSLAGLVVLLADRYRLFNLQVSSAGSPVKSYLPAPFSDRAKRFSPAHSRRSSEETNTAPFSKWRTRIIIGLLAVLITLRVLAARAWLQKVHCAAFNVEVFLPFLLALYDLWATRAPIQLPRDLGSLVNDNRSISCKLWRWCQDSRYTYAISTAYFGFSASFVLSAGSMPQSTYLCAEKSKGAFKALVLQSSGLAIDALAFVCVSELIGLDPQSRSRDAKPRAIGWAMLLSAGLLSFLSATWFLAHPNDRQWMLFLSPEYISSMLKICWAAALTSFCALQLALKAGLLETTMLAAFSFTYISTWISGSVLNHAFTTFNEKPLLVGLATMTVALLYALDALWIPQEGHQINGTINKKMRLLLVSVGVFLFCSRAYLSLAHDSHISYHPIDALIEDAGKRHEFWEKQRAKIDTLGAAVVDYRSRYGRHPPPNFDKWYMYATTRKSVFISEFDGIFNDILPFWSLSPAEVRLRTSQEITQIGNGVGGIRIRNGKAEVGSNVPRSHRWMMKGVIRMMRNFVQWLPDMDLAFNLNDESRVVVPYEDTSVMLQQAMTAFTGRMQELPVNEFTKGGTNYWPKLKNDSIAPYPATQPFQPIYRDYGTAHCSPDSRARSTSAWNTRNLCVNCMSPHSHPLGPFPIDARFATDVCHQPDYAYLHGFYSSPSTFRGTFDLRPTFSQSKAPGFRDIMYPSPWNYLDRDNTTYKPTDDRPDLPFEEKENTLFWRGATTEGFAADDGRGTWQGMTRQRFVALANYPADQNVLLPERRVPDPSPSNKAPEKWSYQQLSTQQLQNYFSTNVSLRHPIARCIHHDCDAQVRFFNTTTLSVTLPHNRPAGSDLDPRILPMVTQHTPLTEEKVDFQSHWRYRFLFDTEGAAFSGRFIPFLKSRSLPIKTTGIFREWWDGRVTAWLHYVPVDNRLAGVYSTLAYFAGLNGRDQSGDLWAGRPDRAQEIAERGREWANKVLRKEDMEIYLFRLLLEWARVVDDNREQLGFAL